MEIVAHRGLHSSLPGVAVGSSLPENSLGAIQAALDAGLTYVEVDVRASGDGDLILMHDGRVDRTTNGSGRLAAMRRGQVGALRTADGMPIARLEAALEVIRGSGVLCVDVKEHALGPAVVRAIRNTRADAEVWSSHEQVVAQASDAGLPSALIAMGLMPDGTPDSLVELARQLGAGAVSFFPADLEPAVVQACAALGMPFMCGTPNDAPTWRAMMTARARAVITDDPLRCREYAEHSYSIGG